MRIQGGNAKPGFERGLISRFDLDKFDPHTLAVYVFGDDTNRSEICSRIGDADSDFPPGRKRRARLDEATGEAEVARNDDDVFARI